MTEDEFREMVRRFFGQKRVIELGLGKAEIEKSASEQVIKQNPYWVFFYGWDIICVGTPRLVHPMEIVNCLRRNQFPHIGKN